MSNFDPALNHTYLKACWHWLELLLRRKAEAGFVPPPRETSFRQRVFRAGPIDDSFASKSETDSDLKKALAAVHAAEKSDPPPRMITLAARLQLTVFEQHILLLCAGTDLHPMLSGLCAAAQRDTSRTYPTFALALELFAGADWHALSVDSRLRALKLIEINQLPGQPLTLAALRADEWVAGYLNGIDSLDDRLAPLLQRLPDAPALETLPPSHQRIVNALRQQLAAAPALAVQLTGADSVSKQIIASTAHAGRPVYRVGADSVPLGAADIETFVRLWMRQYRLEERVLYVDASSEADVNEAQAAATKKLIAKLSAPVFLDVRETWQGIGPETLSTPVDKPTPAEQRTAWDIWLGGFAPGAGAALAGQFNLNLPTMHRVAKIAAAEAGAGPKAVIDTAWDSCVNLTRPRLDLLAEPIAAKATWDQLVLPKEEMQILNELVNQVGQRSVVYQNWGFAERMNRGLGISALFQGESGTGKTMAAEVVANKLRLSLYRIDLSAVVSKYIGETEKNLRKVFDAAEEGGAILFFDEADALFGKRSEVKDSHDRYANIEINYLLQRMEAYRGLAILATNMKNSLDPGFTRRLRFTINFPFPGPAERKLIWQVAFPPEAPVKNLDFEKLAALQLTGGNIHAIALNAAFLAAQADPPEITMTILKQAVAREMQRLNRPMTAMDLRPTDKRVATA